MLDRDETLALGELKTWAGVVHCSASPRGLREIHLPRWAANQEPEEVEPSFAITRHAEPDADAHLNQALNELADYFAGTRRDFTVALDPEGPEFYRRAWDEVARVPYGETRSYGEIAALLGAPQASRAVGAANGANPLAPIVPCHRIVGSDGTLTGYGPGLPLKQILLEMEDAVPADEADYDAWLERVTAQRGGAAFLIGNRRTRQYCAPTCDRARTSTLHPSRIFASGKEAKAAGFSACPVCGGMSQGRLLATSPSAVYNRG